MDDWLKFVVIGVPTFGLAGVMAGWILTRRQTSQAMRERKRLLEEGYTEAERIKVAAREDSRVQIQQQRDAFSEEAREARKELKENERRLAKREDGLDRKIDLLNKKEKKLERDDEGLKAREQQVTKQQSDLENLIEEERNALFRITQMSRGDAEKLLLERMERDLDHEKDILVARAMERVKETVDDRAKNILATVIQRCASTYSQELTTSSIELPNEEMKGRVIGREGRNIRAFEKATGVDVIVDDTPGVITLSCFDSIRREMAGRALQSLIADGRIHPTRIEEVVAEAKTEMNELIQRTGKKVSYDLDIPGLHPKVITLIGRLMFRTSYGQNVLDHSIECANIAGMIAGELGLNVQLAKRCALFHDIGKAVDHQFEGGHPEIGANLLKRYDEPPEVVNSAASHHNDVPQESLYAVITQAADSISGSRPGARGESLERYIKRLEKLESLVTTFPGVKTANAIQAGREVRVFVNAHKVNDKKAVRLCHDIAKEIESQLTYPGEIKVTLIRETRVVEYAR
ncbi:MAG: ribonuclease Y [Planctomycetota bacterium]